MLVSNSTKPSGFYSPTFIALDRRSLARQVVRIVMSRRELDDEDLLWEDQSGYTRRCWSGATKAPCDTITTPNTMVVFHARRPNRQKYFRWSPVDPLSSHRPENLDPVCLVDKISLSREDSLCSPRRSEFRRS